MSVENNVLATKSGDCFEPKYTEKDLLDFAQYIYHNAKVGLSWRENLDLWLKERGKK